MPFGVGTRICGGQNLAQIVLRVALATFVANFDISVNRQETNEKTMQIKDAFVRKQFLHQLPSSLNARVTGHSPCNEGVQAYFHSQEDLSRSCLSSSLFSVLWTLPYTPLIPRSFCVVTLLAFNSSVFAVLFAFCCRRVFVHAIVSYAFVHMAGAPHPAHS